MADNGTMGGVETANTARGVKRRVLYWLSRLHPECHYQPYSTLYCAIINLWDIVAHQRRPPNALLVKFFRSLQG